MTRRADERSNVPTTAADPAGDANAPNGERRTYARRRGDARSVAEVLSASGDAVVKLRRGALYGCGCVAVDAPDENDAVQLLQCPTHAALQAKLRRRQTDRH